MALSLLSLFSCKGYTDLSVADFDKMLSQDATVQLVDVRTADEFADSEKNFLKAALKFLRTVKEKSIFFLSVTTLSSNTKNSKLPVTFYAEVFLFLQQIRMWSVL